MELDKSTVSIPLEIKKYNENLNTLIHVFFCITTQNFTQIIPILLIIILALSFKLVCKLVESTSLVLIRHNLLYLRKTLVSFKI